MNTEKKDELKLDLGSKAPIILLDEIEKVGDPSVIDAVGKVLDEGIN
jgi:ATP-dependent Clp protease ATP-binding subunit ClpA